jgi:hypothetical protein
MDQMENKELVQAQIKEYEQKLRNLEFGKFDLTSKVKTFGKLNYYGNEMIIKLYLTSEDEKLKKELGYVEYEGKLSSMNPSIRMPGVDMKEDETETYQFFQDYLEAFVQLSDINFWVKVKEDFYPYKAQVEKDLTILKSLYAQSYKIENEERENEKANREHNMRKLEEKGQLWYDTENNLFLEVKSNDGKCIMFLEHGFIRGENKWKEFETVKKQKRALGKGPAIARPSKQGIIPIGIKDDLDAAKAKVEKFRWDDWKEDKEKNYPSYWFN